MENEIQEYVAKLKELAVNAKILSEILETSKYKELPSWIQDKIATSTSEISDIKMFVNQKIMSRSNDLLEMTNTTTNSYTNNSNKGSSIVDSYLKASPQGKNLFKNSLTQLDKISTQLSTIKEGEDSSNQLKREILNTIKKYTKLGVASSVIAATLASCEDVAKKQTFLKHKKDSIDYENYHNLRDSLYRKAEHERDKNLKDYYKRVDSVHRAELKKPHYDNNAINKIKDPNSSADYENIKHPGLDTSRFNPKNYMDGINLKNNIEENKRNTNMTKKEKSLKEKYDTMYSKIKGDKTKVSKLNESFKRLGLNENFFNLGTGKPAGTGFKGVGDSMQAKFSSQQLSFITKVKELVDRMIKTVGRDKILDVLDYYIDNNMIIDLSDFQVQSNKIPVYENKQIKSLVDKIIKEEVTKVLKNKKTLNENMNDASLVDMFKKDLYDITCEPTDMNEIFDNSDISQTSKLMNIIKQKFSGLDVDMNKIYDVTKKYIKMGLASAVIISALSSCATECANEKISQRNNARYGRKVKHNNSNAFQRQNNAQFRGARVNKR